MKKIITIEYEPGLTPNCDECPFDKKFACGYLERLGIYCNDVKINDVTVREE